MVAKCHFTGVIQISGELEASRYVSWLLCGNLRDQFRYGGAPQRSNYYTKSPYGYPRMGTIPMLPFILAYTPIAFFDAVNSGDGLISCLRIPITLARRVAAGEDWRRFIARHFVYEFGHSGISSSFWGGARPLSIRDALSRSVWPGTDLPASVILRVSVSGTAETPRHRQLQPSDSAH